MNRGTKRSRVCRHIVEDDKRAESALLAAFVVALHYGILLAIWYCVVPSFSFGAVQAVLDLSGFKLWNAFGSPNLWSLAVPLALWSLLAACQVLPLRPERRYLVAHAFSVLALGCFLFAVYLCFKLSPAIDDSSHGGYLAFALVVYFGGLLTGAILCGLVPWRTASWPSRILAFLALVPVVLLLVIFTGNLLYFLFFSRS